MAKRTFHGNADVTTGGTAVPLSTTPQYIEEVTIQAKSTNTGSIYIGTTDDMDSTDFGIEIEAKAIAILKPKDITDLWIDAETDGEGVTFIATTK